MFSVVGVRVLSYSVHGDLCLSVLLLVMQVLDAINQVKINLQLTHKTVYTYITGLN